MITMRCGAASLRELVMGRASSTTTRRCACACHRGWESSLAERQAAGHQGAHRPADRRGTVRGRRLGPRRRRGRRPFRLGRRSSRRVPRLRGGAGALAGRCGRRRRLSGRHLRGGSTAAERAVPVSLAAVARPPIRGVSAASQEMLHFLAAAVDHYESRGGRSSR